MYHDDMESFALQRVCVFPPDDPAFILAEAKGLLAQVSPKSYHPIDLYVSIRAAAKENDLAVRRVFNLIRASLDTHVEGPRPMTHHTHADALSLMERGVTYAALKAAGVPVA